jgi:hypothetical protein
VRCNILRQKNGLAQSISEKVAKRDGQLSRFPMNDLLLLFDPDAWLRIASASALSLLEMAM